jgi:hypothetical protein
MESNEDEWVYTLKLAKQTNQHVKYDKNAPHRNYRPIHKDILYQLLNDIKISTERHQEENSTINSISNGIFQFPLLEKTTCLKSIQEFLHIFTHFPTTPLNVNERM